jgi:release factor glutamine methyltransferase
VDIDPEAVRCTRANAALQNLEIEALESDLFSALAGRTFDRVAYNLPFWPGEPGDRPFGRAMHAGTDFRAIREFVASFPAHAPEARVVLSERGGDFAAARAALGASTLLTREHHRGEWLDLFRLDSR